MEKFGYTISKIRQIDYDSNDRSIADYIASGEPSFLKCIECGCCSATCTTGNFTRFSLRELNILIKRGENTQVRNNIRKCGDEHLPPGVCQCADFRLHLHLQRAHTRQKAELYA